jgi:hypothetical protein
LFSFQSHFFLPNQRYMKEPPIVISPLDNNTIVTSTGSRLLSSIISPDMVLMNNSSIIPEMNSMTPIIRIL